MYCLICEKEVSPKGRHLKYEHNITSKEYYDKYLKKENEEFCTVCGKETEFYSLKHGYKKFCCIECKNSKEGKNITSKKTKITVDKVYGGRENILKKSRKTMVENYGVEYSGQNKDSLEKTQNTKLEKYGNKYFNNEKCKEIKEREMITKRKKGYDKFLLDINKKHLNYLDNKDNYVNGDIFNFKCDRCGSEFESKSQNLEDVKCSCSLQYGVSFEELDLREFIESLDIKVEYNNRYNVGTTWYEIDIYLPDFNIGIEYDGVYWHSDKFKDDTYHINKTLSFKHNYDMDIIHVFSNEWIYNREFIENIIKMKIGLIENTYLINNFEIDLRYFNENDFKDIIIKDGYESRFYYQKNNKLYNIDQIEENKEYNKIYDCGSIIIEEN